MDNVRICPSPEELAAFFDKGTSEDRARKVREHLLLCRKCAQDIKGLPKLLRLAKASSPLSNAWEKYLKKSEACSSKKRVLSRRTNHPAISEIRD